MLHVYADLAIHSEQLTVLHHIIVVLGRSTASQMSHVCLPTPNCSKLMTSHTVVQFQSSWLAYVGRVGGHARGAFAGCCGTVWPAGLLGERGIY